MVVATAGGRMTEPDMQTEPQRSERRRVLIFGDKTRAGAAIWPGTDALDVDVVDGIGGVGDLADYELVVLDYSTFLGTEGHLDSYGQELFEKQMLRALAHGTTFCFVHYDDIAPRDGYPDEFTWCFERQIGFRWLAKFGIEAYRSPSPILLCQVRRNEFQEYMSRHGTSKNYFSRGPEAIPWDIIADGPGKNCCLAFAVRVTRGRVIYLPCQLNVRASGSVDALFRTLITSAITYIVRTRSALPLWAAEPLFEEEKSLVDRRAHFEQQLADCQHQLNPFSSAKGLLFESEYGLEDAIAKFLRTECGIGVEREETYREDFWLLDTGDQRAAICEVKSHLKGLRKTDIYALYSHRDGYQLKEDYPAVLFVNVNMNAASWKQKRRPLDKQLCQLAADNNILIVRIEDLLFAWDSIRQARLASADLLATLTSKVGWLRFNSDGTWKVVG
jgi:hypothetical protein